MNWIDIANKALNGGSVSRDEARSVLDCSDDELLGLLDAAFAVRRKAWGRGVKLHVLRNAKSGSCRENCSFCSQAIGAYSGVDRYRMQSVEELVEGAREAYERKAVKYCMVTATRGPSPRELETVCEAVRQIKQEMPMEICTSLGLLTGDQARQLAEAGVNRFNHNLETSRNYFPNICQTHTWEDRLATVHAAKNAGMEICCGGIMGMGEGPDDRVDLALTLKDLDVASIPVNFLDPREGTLLEERVRPTPNECLKCLCMFRLVNPCSEIRIAGGREVCLRHLQPLALFAADSMFTEGYLTTPGQGYEKDLAMIAEAGFYVAEVE